MTVEDKLKQIVKLLQKPTPHEHIKFLPKGMKSKDGGKRHFAMAIPYVDIAFVRQRMDDACGPFGWKSEAKEVNGLSFCGISIRSPVSGEWISRWDTGQDDAWHENEKGKRVEGEKFSMGARGIFSISFKRAAYQWGVGRDVLAMRVFRCECDTYEMGDRTYFKGWVENPLVKQVAEMEIRQALPPTTEGNLEGMRPVVEGGSQVSKYEDTGASAIATNCRNHAIYSCGMTKKQYDVILNDYEQDGGCRTATYADLYNWLQFTYRPAKLEIIKEANKDLTVADRPFDMSDDLHEKVLTVVNPA